MKVKQLIDKLQKLLEEGSGVDPNWSVYLYDGEIKDVQAFPAKDGDVAHIREANEIVLEFDVDHDAVTGVQSPE